MQRLVPSRSSADASRSGAATVDYALVLGIILPLATIVIPASIRIIRLVYEMFIGLVSWPFL